MPTDRYPTADAADRILRARAQMYAAPLRGSEPRLPDTQILGFTRGGDRYGLELDSVAQVVVITDVTPVPGTPASIAGVFSHHGRVLTLVDLWGLAGDRSTGGDVGRGDPDDGGGSGDTSGPTGSSRHLAVIVQAGETAFGLLVAELLGVTAWANADLTVPPPAIQAGRGFIRAVTTDLLAVLNPEALLSDPRVIVDT